MLVFPYLRPYTSHKLSYRSTACIFLGYAPSHKGYICLDPTSSRFYISKNVLFHEASFPFREDPSLVSPPVQQPNSISTPTILPTLTFSLSSSSTSRLPSPIQVPFASLVSSASPFLPPFPINCSVHQDLPIVNTHAMITRNKYGIQKKKAYFTQLREPRTYLQASKHQVWINAMNTEYNALIKNNTWSLVTSPPRAHIVGSNWIYIIKYNVDGSVNRFKARLVSQCHINCWH